MHWRSTMTGADAMRGAVDDQVLYTAGWTISGLVTLATIVAVWLFGI